MKDKFKEFIDTHLLSGTNNLGLAIVLATMVLVPIVSLMFLAAFNADGNKQHRIELMKLCLDSGETFEECKFKVYGGIRITTDHNQLKVKE